MDILKKLIERVQKYYALVECHETQVQDWIKETKKPLHSITNQSAILRAVVPINSVIGTPFEKFEGFRDLLVEKILASLQEEVSLLEEIRDKIGAANEKLYCEQQQIEDLYTSLRDKNSEFQTQLNPCCPSFKNISTWCYDVWCYYHSFYLQLLQSLVHLNFEDEHTVETLVQSFKESSELKNHINKIRNFNFQNFEFFI